MLCNSKLTSLNHLIQPRSYYQSIDFSEIFFARYSFIYWSTFVLSFCSQFLSAECYQHMTHEVNIVIMPKSGMSFNILTYQANIALCQ